MKLVYHSIKGGGGGDITIENLSKAATNQFNIDFEVRLHPKQMPFLPPFLRINSKKDIENYDIIHSNIDCAFAFKNEAIPIISTIYHLVYDTFYESYMTPFQKMYHKLLNRHISKSLAISDVVVAISNYTKTEVEKKYSVSDIKIIYPGIDTQIFKPIEIEPVQSDKIKLLFVGNNTKRKGIDLLPKIMNHLDDRFVLYYTSGVRNKAATFRDKRLIPIGKPSLNELIMMYNKCNVLVFPSRLEGFGMPVVEAMACEKPVVASNCSSLPEIIIDGETGFLCHTDNATDFADKIQLLANDKTLRDKMGRFGRITAINKFSVEEQADKYIRLYKKIIKDHR